MRIDMEETSGEYSLRKLSPHSYAYQTTVLQDMVPDTRPTIVTMIHILVSGRLQFKSLYFNYLTMLLKLKQDILLKTSS